MVDRSTGCLASRSTIDARVSTRAGGNFDSFCSRKGAPTPRLDNTRLLGRQSKNDRRANHPTLLQRGANRGGSRAGRDRDHLLGTVLGVDGCEWVGELADAAVEDGVGVAQHEVADRTTDGDDNNS